MSEEFPLNHLKARIESAQKATSFENKELPSRTQTGKLVNVGVDLVAGVIMGTGLGLLIDGVFKISPWGLISFFIMGSIAGILNVMRTLKKTESQ